MQVMIRFAVWIAMELWGGTKPKTEQVYLVACVAATKVLPRIAA